MPDYSVTVDPSVPHPFALLAASDDLIFVTGLASPGDTATEQARRTLDQMAALLEEAGSSMSEVVYFRPLVTKREYAIEIDAVLREAFPEPRPASGALIICELAGPELMVEFEAIAQRGARRVLRQD